MKYITMEQFNKASDKIQCKILGWWIPADGDLMYNLETKEREVFEPSYMDVDCVHSYCIPLLTVGQLIMFIEKTMGCKMDIMYSELTQSYEILVGTYNEFFKKELLETLWQVANKLADNEIV